MPWRLLVLTSLLARFAIAQLVVDPVPVRAVLANGITSSATVIDNRSTATRRSTMHTFCALGSGTFSAQIQYSNTATTGPWTSFANAGSSVSQASTSCVGTGEGYHAYIRFLISGTVTVSYRGVKDVWIGGGGSGGGGGGGVSSVGLSLPVSLFSVTNSPVTGTGTLTGSLITQAANAVLAGPTTGANAVPTMRALVAADIPNLSSVYQPLSSALTIYSGITPSANIQSLLGAANYAAMRTLLAYTASMITNTPAGGIAATDLQTAVNELDTEKQASDAELTALAALVSAANKFPYYTGSGTAALADLSAFARTILDDANAAAVYATLGPPPTADALTANGGNCSATNEAAAGVSAAGVAEGCRPAPQIFFGTAAPGSVSGNRPGDVFSDTTNHNWYGCNAASGTAAPACTSVGTNGWQLLNDGAGGGTGNAAAGVTTTFGTSMTFTCPSSSAGTLVAFTPTTSLTADVTSSALSGCGTNSQRLTFTFVQDATGNRTVAYPTGFTNIPDIAPVANSTTTIDVVWNGTIARLTGYSTVGAGDILPFPEQSSAPAGESGKGLMYALSSDHKIHVKLDGGSDDEVCTLSAGCGSTGGGLSGSSAINFASMEDGQCIDNTFTLTGLTAGQAISVGLPASLSSGILSTGIASATDTAKIRLCNASGATVDLASLTYSVTAPTAISGSGTINFGNILDGTCAAASTFTLTGAAAGTRISVGPPAGFESGLLLRMVVSATDTVSVQPCNYSGTDVNPASGTFSAAIL